MVWLEVAASGVNWVFLSKSDAGADGNLDANNTIATEETWSEDADLVPKKLTDDARNGTTTKDCKGMTAVGSDNQVFVGYRRLKAN